METETIKSQYERMLALSYNDNERLISEIEESLEKYMTVKFKHNNCPNQKVMKRIDKYENILNYAKGKSDR